MIATRLTQRVSLVEQELRTLPEHLSSPPVFSGVRVTRSLVLYVCLLIVVCSFVLFLLAIALSVLRYMDSDYPLVSSNSSYRNCISEYSYIRKVIQFFYIDILKSLEDLIILI